GRTDLQDAVKKLPADLQATGKQAAAEFADKFDELNQSGDNKGTELVDTLATKYTEALKSVDDEIAAEKEKNKGVVDKAVDAVKGVIKAIKELMSLLLGVLRKAAQAISAIINDPIGFLKNLVSAVGAGLKQFMHNIGKHLEQGIMSWLLGTASEAGIQLPAKFDVRGIVMLIAGLLGLTWANIRARITRKVPDKAVTAAETALPLVVKVKKDGVGGLWDDIKERVGDLKKDLVSKVIKYLTPTIIIAGITWVLSLLNPASAFVRAAKLIIDIVRFVVERARQIIEFVDAVLDAVIAIAKGAGGGLPDLIEKALAKSIPVLIGFLAAILGVGGIANKVKQTFQTLSNRSTKPSTGSSTRSPASSRNSGRSYGPQWTDRAAAAGTRRGPTAHNRTATGAGTSIATRTGVGRVRRTSGATSLSTRLSAGRSRPLSARLVPWSSRARPLRGLSTGCPRSGTAMA